MIPRGGLGVLTARIDWVWRELWWSRRWMDRSRRRAGPIVTPSKGRASWCNQQSDTWESALRSRAAADWDLRRSVTRSKALGARRILDQLLAPGHADRGRSGRVTAATRACDGSVSRTAITYRVRAHRAVTSLTRLSYPFVIFRDLRDVISHLSDPIISLLAGCFAVRAGRQPPLRR